MQTILSNQETTEFIQRINNINPEAKAIWGKMNVSQMLKHCSEISKVTFGEKKVKRPFISKLIGGILLKKSIGNDLPIGKNKPTLKELVITNTRDFNTEKEELIGLVNRYSSSNKDDFQGRIHPFFGKMNSEQWSKLINKHLDHHLRQFNA